MDEVSLHLRKWLRKKEKMMRIWHQVLVKDQGLEWRYPLAHSLAICTFLGEKSAISIQNREKGLISVTSFAVTHSLFHQSFILRSIVFGLVWQHFTLTNILVSGATNIFCTTRNTLKNTSHYAKITFTFRLSCTVRGKLLLCCGILPLCSTQHN